MPRRSSTRIHLILALVAVVVAVVVTVVLILSAARASSVDNPLHSGFGGGHLMLAVAAVLMARHIDAGHIFGPYRPTMMPGDHEARRTADGSYLITTYDPALGDRPLG